MQTDGNSRADTSGACTPNSEVTLALKPASPEAAVDGQVEQFTSSAMESTLKRGRSRKTSAVKEQDKGEPANLEVARLNSASTDLSKQLREGEDLKITFDPLSLASAERGKGARPAMTSTVVQCESSPKRVVLSKQYAHIQEAARKEQEKSNQLYMSMMNKKAYHPRNYTSHNFSSHDASSDKKAVKFANFNFDRRKQLEVKRSTQEFKEDEIERLYPE